MKKKMKRMMDGGMAIPTRGTMPNERGAMPVRGGGGVPLQGPGGVIVKPPVPEMKPRPVRPGPILGGGKGSEYPGMQKMMERPSIRGKSMRDLRAGVGPFSLMDKVKAARGMEGGGKMIPGSRGVSNSPGRVSPDYAKTRAGASPITQIESNTLAGIRPDPVSGRQPTPVPRVDMTAPRQPGQKGYGMKGGGLARKGVGMALAKGGLVNANGCAQRGKTKGRMM